MTWEIFLGIVALISFVIAIAGPMLKLNTSITKLNSSVDVLKNALDKIDADNEKSHRRIWEHNEEQDKLISENAQRIVSLQHTIDILHPETLGIRKQ